MLERAIKELEVISERDTSVRYFDIDQEAWDVEPRVRVKVRSKETKEVREYSLRNVFDFGLVVNRNWGDEGKVIDGINVEHAEGTIVEGDKLYTKYDFYNDNRERIKPCARWNSREKCWEFRDLEALERIKRALGVTREADEFDHMAILLLRKGAPAKFRAIRM